MKKLFLFVALLTWIGFSASAQIRTDSSRQNMPLRTDSMQQDMPRPMEMQQNQNPSHWTFKDGKVMEMRDGKSSELKSERKIGDVWLRTNGQVVTKDNKVTQLREDQYIDEDGKIHTGDPNQRRRND